MYCHTLPLHDSPPISHSAAASNPGRIEILRSEADIGGLSCMLDFRLAAHLAQPLQFGLRGLGVVVQIRSEEHTSELQSLMRISYAVFCLKKKKPRKTKTIQQKLKNNTQ